MKRFCRFASIMLCIVLTAAIGCNKPGGKDKGKDKDSAAKHDHPDAGPHGGPLVEWGEEEYHVEVLVDRPKQEVRAYILGPDAKKATPIKSDKLTLAVKTPKFEVELKPEPAKDDPKGTSSVFVGKHENLGKEGSLSGELRADVAGTPFNGEYEEKAPKKK